MKTQLHTDGHRIYVGDWVSVSFQRTLRVPEDGHIYPLPSSLGPFPVSRAAELGLAGNDASDAFDFCIPIYQREALWIGFDGAEWKPHAIKVAAGRINVITGQPLEERLRVGIQDYLVCPDQPWLDGINAGRQHVRQFVAMPLGSGYTIESQLQGEEDRGWIHILVYEPKSGRFPDVAPPERETISGPAMLPPSAPGLMGLAAGGQIRQRIYPDRYGIDTWRPDKAVSVCVGLLNSEQFRALTGHEPPPSPVTARSYIEHGLPWFDLYDEHRGDIAPSPTLTGVRSVGQIDAEKRGATSPDTPEVDTAELPVQQLRPPGREQRPKTNGGE